MCHWTFSEWYAATPCKLPRDPPKRGRHPQMQMSRTRLPQADLLTFWLLLDPFLVQIPRGEALASGSPLRKDMVGFSGLKLFGRLGAIGLQCPWKKSSCSERTREGQAFQPGVNLDNWDSVRNRSPALPCKWLGTFPAPSSRLVLGQTGREHSRRSMALWVPDLFQEQLAWMKPQYWDSGFFAF